MKIHEGYGQTGTPSAHLAESSVLGWLDRIDIVIKDQSSNKERFQMHRRGDVEMIPQKSGNDAWKLPFSSGILRDAF